MIKYVFPLILVLSILGCLNDSSYERPNNQGINTSIMDAGMGGPDLALGRACNRTFVYRHAGVALPSSVKLAGSFEVEPWSAGIEMDGPNSAGEYAVSLQLADGNYQYKFVVDGVWSTDPENEAQTDDADGNANSLVSHRCPFEPECTSNSDCDGDLVCRGYECKPCQCTNDWSCHPETKQCVETIPCTESADCSAGLVCRGNECAACVSDSECQDGTVCLASGCGTAQCNGDAECNIEQESCKRYECEPKACDEQNFFLADSTNRYRDVRLAGEFTEWENAALTMERLDDSRWWVRARLENGVYQYKFIVTDANGNETWISDPDAEESINDGLGGANSVRTVSCIGGVSSLCGDPDVFDWRDAVMYFAMVDRFFDSDGMRIIVDGATDDVDARLGPNGQFQGGDLLGLTQKLGYLDTLGVSALWLSAPYDNRDFRGDAINACGPEGEVNGCDPNFYSSYHGYWPSPQNVDYADPDNPSPIPLVESRLGTDDDLRALIDAAHASDMKVLFDYVMNHIDVASPLYSAHPEWFASRQDGSFFKCGESEDGQLGWDHPYWGTRCVFTDYLPAFDFENEAARAWSVADALWWAKTYGIDGYRLDAIKHVPQSWLTELRSALTQAFPEPDGGRFYLVGETFDYFNKDLLKSFVDVETKLDGQFDFPLKKRLCEGVFQGNMTELQRFMDNENRAFYGPGALMTTWIGNHDIPRAIHYASGEIQNCTEGSNQWNGWDWRPSQPQEAAAYERLGLAFGVLFTTEGIPLLYYGDEIGLAGGGDPDNRRLMPWNDEMLLPAQLALRGQIQQLARIRSEYKALSRGGRQTLSVDGDLWAYQASCQDERFDELIVVINRGDAPRNNIGVPPGRYIDLLTDQELNENSNLAARSMLILKRVQE